MAVSTSWQCTYCGESNNKFERCGYCAKYKFEDPI